LTIEICASVPHRQLDFTIRSAAISRLIRFVAASNAVFIAVKGGLLSRKGPQEEGYPFIYMKFEAPRIDRRSGTKAQASGAKPSHSAKTINAEGAGPIERLTYETRTHPRRASS
jgi:hypothetical protein